MTSEQIVKTKYPESFIIDQRSSGKGYVVRTYTDSCVDYAIGKTEVEAWMRAKIKMNNEKKYNE